MTMIYVLVLANTWELSTSDRTPALAVSADGLVCQAREFKEWHGCRATKGLINSGKYYYEAKVTDEGLCRVGWSTIQVLMFYQNNIRAFSLMKCEFSSPHQ